MPKIISFYILNQVLKTLLITFIILFGILFFNQSIDFLEKASNGELYPSLVSLVLIFSVPSILEVVIPASVFIGTLISIYNLKKTNEITFASQAGLSNLKLIYLSLIPSAVISIFLIFNSFFISPSSNERLSFLSNSQSFADNFKLMGEGKVNQIKELNGVFYAEGASDLGFQNIFAKIESDDLNYILNSDEVTASSSDDSYNQIIFEQGELVIPLEKNDLFLNFQSLIFLFPKNQVIVNEDIKTKNWYELINKVDSKFYLSEIFERISLSLMLIVSVLIAVPLSLKMHESGRFLLIFSGLVIFLSYYGLVIGQKVFVEEGILSPIQIFLIIHGVYLSLGLSLFGLNNYVLDINSIVARKYSKKWFIQLSFFFFLVILFFNFIFL
ncbi:MAG: LptF/LptG family permease [Gammaproteobacteria bacterium]|nr:MAG: LptF/LptG family permease [Gammaproteobacteria bacterium]|tara:strand:- start:234 stop:1388 length:1155 start_codon:yes stop_codon:yes gene_type:complete